MYHVGNHFLLKSFQFVKRAGFKEQEQTPLRILRGCIACLSYYSTFYLQRALFNSKSHTNCIKESMKQCLLPVIFLQWLKGLLLWVACLKIYVQRECHFCRSPKKNFLINWNLYHLADRYAQIDEATQYIERDRIWYKCKGHLLLQFSNSKCFFFFIILNISCKFVGSFVLQGHRLVLFYSSTNLKFLSYFI